MPAGRPTDLTKEVLSKIKEAILDGKTLRDFAKENEISESTVYSWTRENYDNISTKIEGWKRDRMLMLAEKNIKNILAKKPGDDVEKKIQANMSQFAAKTLGKKHYSDRVEMTGADGEKLEVGVVILPAQDV